jgi:cytochrome c biogenesis protein CcmG/thiol:disulfide interchange protein DsbE
VIVLALAVVGLLIYGVAAGGDDSSLDAAVQRNEQPVAPGANVALPLLDGKGSLSLDELRGQIVVLNFWASWCEPCAEEAPILVRAQRELKAKGDGTVLGVTYKDFADESRAFVRRYGLNYPSVRDDKLELAPGFGTTALPETFVIDSRGRVVAVGRGQLKEEFLDGAIARARGEK